MNRFHVVSKGLNNAKNIIVLGLGMLSSSY